jgi:CspA family cold shock protein
MKPKVLDSSYLHSSGLMDQIRENDSVEYDVENGKKGLNAVNVKRA